MMFRTYSSLGSIGALAAALLMQTACMTEATSPGSRAVVVDRTTQALTSGQLESVNGTYMSCSHRVDGSAWSIGIGNGGTLDNAELSVILNDTNCVLTMTSLHTSAGVIDAVPAIVLTTSYQSAPSAFGNPVEFYANAKLDSVSFANEVVLTLVYSDDSSLATRSSTAGFAVVSSTATAQSVAAPDYALDVSGLALLTDVNDVVVSAIGSAALTSGSVTGQTYVVVDENSMSTLDTYAELDAAYLAGTAAALTATIPAMAFTLAGDDLTTSQIRTLIIANTSHGVASYQALAITFIKAP
jgi:hypothetical protein